MSSGDLRIQAGQYWIDKTCWFDLRLTDGGWVISLCDMDLNVRYTAMIDDGKIMFGEVDKLVSDEAASKLIDPAKLPPKADRREEEESFDDDMTSDDDFV